MRFAINAIIYGCAIALYSGCISGGLLYGPDFVCNPISDLNFSGVESATGVSGSYATLNWTEPSTGAYQYLVYDISGGSPVLFSSVDAPSSSILLSGLSQSTLYEFRVRVMDTNGFVDANEKSVVFTTTAQTLPDSPSTVANLSLWVRADTGVEEAIGDSAENGDPVRRWVDQSGNGNDIEQSTIGNQPLYVTGVVNGLPVVRFDGTDDFMSFGTGLATSRSLWIVIRFDSTTQTNYGPIWGHSTGLSQYIFSDNYLEVTFSLAGYVGGTWYESGAVFTANTEPVKTSWEIVSVNTSVNVSVDRITRDRAFTARVMGADIAEMFIFDRVLTDPERLDLQTYLGDKYGITVP